MDEATEGHYYRTQIGNKNKVIAWSHEARFVKALELIGPSTRRLLDYGCGDGTLMVMAADLCDEVHGVDVDAHQIADCRTRLGSIENLSFFTNEEVAEPGFDGSYDVVTCMETLEHCTAPAVESALADVARLCAPGGRVIISVPIEIGLSFLVKQSVRAIAKRQYSDGYQRMERYSVRDGAKMLFARRTTEVDRFLIGEPPVVGYSHYGFNWRGLRERVSAHLDVDETLFTPLGFLGGLVSSQAYFVCRPKR
jgi:2-polyprenyl-3-methyl-5-hydroxy-6-metoxy-1,4-benzoquinol methylase